MILTELVDRVAKETGLTKTDTKTFIKGFTTAVAQAIAEGEEVKLPDFGSFASKIRPERTMITVEKKMVVVPEHKLVKFTAYGKLKDMVK